jgi:hypothetical protein
LVRLIRSATRLFQVGAGDRLDQVLGPAFHAAVMNGRLTSVVCAEDSSILAFSAASFSR